MPTSACWRTTSVTELGQASFERRLLIGLAVSIKCQNSIKFGGRIKLPT